jgi:hypothetical protein
MSSSLIRRRDFDETGLNERVDLYVMRFEGFANDLPMHLAARRYIDRKVTLYFCMTTQPPTRNNTAMRQELLFGLAG